MEAVRSPSPETGLLFKNIFLNMLSVTPTSLDLISSME